MRFVRVERLLVEKLKIEGDEDELREMALACMDAIERGQAKANVGDIKLKFVNTELV